MELPSSRRLRASHFCLAALLWFAAAWAGASGISRHDLEGGDYEEVRQMLLEAIESEGLIPGAVSQFGAMLHRSDQNLGHGADIYERAEIFSFCSVIVSARLVIENPERIADCPLTIALYQLKGSTRISLVYRPREGTSPGARAANGLMARIAGRTMDAFAPASPMPPGGQRAFRLESALSAGPLP